MHKLCRDDLAAFYISILTVEDSEASIVKERGNAAIEFLDVKIGAG